MPNGKEGTVEIPLPKGMTKEAFLKAFGTFQTARVTGKLRDTATRSAVKTLMERHKPEYDKLYADAFSEAETAGVV